MPACQPLVPVDGLDGAALGVLSVLAEAWPDLESPDLESPGLESPDFESLDFDSLDFDSLAFSAVFDSDEVDEPSDGVLSGFGASFVPSFAAEGFAPELRKSV